MRALKAFLPLLVFILSCTNPDIPVMQDKEDDAQTTGSEQPTLPDDGNGTNSNITSMKIVITAGDKTATATLVRNATTDRLGKILSNGPLSYVFSDNGFETYGDIGQTLPTSNESITAAPGDILLYSSRYICIFWGANTYSYTRLGHLDGMTVDEIKDTFKGNVQIEIQLAF